MQISGFISKAACRGYRPRSHIAHQGRQRPHLIARLAKERSIARFVVAPAGYGKTSLVIDYAETMFSWAHVFWFNAQSPCFIRDLDGEGIAVGCFEVDSKARLVVFDDVPQLDAARAERLSEEIDELLSRGCEVIVTCLPSCDLLGGFQIDRVRVGATDFLLTDEELDACRSEEERLRIAAPFVPPACRVPALVWDSTSESTIAFVANNLGEDLPADLLLATCSAFALGQGSLDDLSSIGPIDVQLALDSLSDYPHLGFDAETGRFEAPRVDAGILARAVKGRFIDLVARSRFNTHDELALAWAEILLDQASSSGWTFAGRACDVVGAFCTPRCRAAWLVASAHDLVRRGCFYPMLRLVRSLKSCQHECRDRIRSIEALCNLMLGDEQEAVRIAKRCGFDMTAPIEARTIGLLIVAHRANGQLQASAESLLSEIASAQVGDDGGLSWPCALAAAWRSRLRGIDGLCEEWARLHQECEDDDVLYLVASWLFQLAGDAFNESLMFDAESIEAVERFVRSGLSEGDAFPVDFFIASAGLSMEEAHMRGMPFSAGPLDSAVLLGLRRMEMAVIMQRRAFEQGAHEERVRRSNMLAEGPLYGGKSPGLTPIAQRAVPIMEIKTFGRFDISIGGVPIDQSKIGRKQARVLLVLLAANQGRDISREATAQAMWPTRDPERARKYFYTTWSQLRKALSLPDGSCPYLVKRQFGCRLDDRYVRSDLARLDDICRELLFGRLDFEGWLDIYTEIDRDFSGELLPVEEKSPIVQRLRDERRGHLVDALVAATMRLVEAGSAQWGIWFAREAIKREKVREDAYVALMRAQVAHNQRTAAMMTYLECRRVLSEELGIDPSPETTALYENLLDG